MSPTMNPLATLLLLLLPLHSSAADPLPGCNLTFSCGSLTNLSYPFTGAARPSHCGPPPFHLTCQEDDIPLLTAHNSLTYRVLHHDPPTQTMRLARSDLFDTRCTQRFVNTSFDPSFFSVVPAQETLSLFYGCNESAILSRAETVFSCATNGAASNNDSFFLFGSVPSITTSFDIHCRTSVNVPILITWSHEVGAKRSLLEVLRYGFNVSYSNPYAPNCDVCAKSGGQCRFDAELGKPICICGDRLCPGGKFTKRLTIIIGITSTIGVLILVSIVATYFKRRELSSVVGMIKWRKNSKYNVNIEAFMSNHSSHTPQRYSYSEVKRMTNSFTTKLGQGGFGSVYKGKLLDGRLVAVKMLDKSKADGQEFFNEVASISRTNHINVVTMLGFCYDGRYRALIYEFMPNGSLDKLIFHRGADRNKRSTHQLEWKVLFEIAVGIAKGLEYLHGGCNIRIVHFDIKPHNILLDEDFCPKISDFGLAKLRNRNESIVSLTGAKGTIGYIAPEIVFRSYGGVSSKSDVYSYGIMILEMVGGRTREIDDEGCSNSSEIYFPDQFYEYFKLEDFSTIYGVLTNDEENVARKMILVGLWCIQTNPSSRPSMVKVVDMLEGSLESLQIPPKPYLYPPTILIQENSTMASSTRYTESQMDEQMISIM